jgi:hypothetical protein
MNQSGAQINGLVTIGILLHILCDTTDLRACQFILHEPSTIWLGSISCMHGYLLVATGSSMEDEPVRTSNKWIGPHLYPPIHPM